MKKEAHLDIKKEPMLANFHHSSILSQNSLKAALDIIEDQKFTMAVKEDMSNVKEK